MPVIGPLPRLLTIDQLAEHLGVTPRHVRRLVAERRVPFLKWRRFIRFDPAEIAAWLDNARQPRRTNKQEACMVTAPEPLRLFEAAVRDGGESVSPGDGQAGRLADRCRPSPKLANLSLRAQARFAAAVILARRAGCSWRLIGTAAGVPYQSLHRRFAVHPLSGVPVRDARDA